MEVGKLKILIVDDDPRFSEVLKNNLESKNCLVQCAFDKRTALRLLINEVFHAVFIDCVLSEGQGIQLVQDVKNILGNSVEILMMSGIIPEKSLSSYIDLGVFNFLSKPISEKEMEDNIHQLQEKYLFGNKQNKLVKLFSHKSSGVESLKYLISLKKAQDHELFLYLNKALLSKESIEFKLEFNNEKHTLICHQGEVANYSLKNADKFLNRLVAKNWLSVQEKSQMEGQSQDSCVKLCLNNSLLSSMQIAKIKHEMLFETLKSIRPGLDIVMSVNLISFNKPSFMLINQSEFADMVFLFLKQKFNNQLFSLFNKEVMEKHLIFEEDLPEHLPEVKNFLTDLKAGMKLQGVYEKYKNKNLFCIYLLYILLKGQAFLSESQLNVRFHYLFERYKSLNKFMAGVTNPETLFLLFKGISESVQINPDEVKSSYQYFIKYNHPDSIPFDLPKDLLSSIEKVLFTVKNFYNNFNNPKLKSNQEKQKKKEKLEKEMIHTEKKKICERHLEKQNYLKAFSLIQGLPEVVREKEVYWQFLYLWIHFQHKNTVKVNIKTVHKYMKSIQAKSRDLSREKLYYFVIGLYNESNKNYEQAKLCFTKARSLDPTFQPCYPAIKRCSIHILEDKQKNQPFIKKLKSLSLSDFKKAKKKKTG